jgi:hypothetical protein
MNASVNAASPTVVGDQIFLSACYGTGATLVRVRGSNLDEVWKDQGALACHFSTPVYCDGVLYGFDGRQEEGARLRAIDWKTGKVHWTQEGFGCGSLIRAGGTLIVMSEGGDLVLLEASPKAYKELARASVLTGPVRAHMAMADGRLFARDNKRLICWNLKK